VRVRELARVELDQRPNEEMTAAIKNWLPVSADSDAEVVNLSEALWMQERRGLLQDARAIKRLATGQNAQGRVVGARSLRHWGGVLGDEGIALAKKLLKDDTDRVRLAAISSLSFLREQDEKWETILKNHSEAKGSALASMLSTAQNLTEGRMQPVIPILAPDARTRLSKWTMKDGKGTIWFRADQDVEMIIGSSGNAQINVDLNDLPVIRNAGSNFTSDYQAPAQVKKGLNKVHYFLSTGGRKKKKARAPAITLSDLSGQLPKGITYPKNAEETNAWAAEYDKSFAVVGDTQISI
jgi:hypothetical protein